MTSKRRSFAVDPHARDDKLGIHPSPQPTYTLEELLEGVKRKNIHAEIDTGPSVGREQW